MRSNTRARNAQNTMLDEVSIQIEDELCGLRSTPQETSIFRVQNQLRRVNEKAYKPECVAIGPCHRCNGSNNNHLQYVEDKKLHYLQQMLTRREETSVDRYVQALRTIEAEARRQYDRNISLPNEGQFIKMMLLDGCFIIEYFRKYKMMTLGGDEKDPLLSIDWIRYNIQRDLLLLENQLPFMVLATLYDLTKEDKWFDKQHNLIDLAWNFFVGGTNVFGVSGEMNCMHLLDLQYLGLISKVSQKELTMTRKSNRFSFIRSATELKESGIEFKGVNRDMFDIKFNKGTLEIPTIAIQDHTESFFRNVIAYEQHCQGGKTNYVTDYVIFMDCLVNTPKDVELLRQKGIITNYLGDDEVVSTMFNKMGEYVTLSNFYYASIFIEVNEQCRRRRNRWMALLRREHFNSPWALISVLAGLVLLLLTLTQTIYTVLSYYEKGKKD